MVIPLYLLMYFKAKFFYLGYFEAQAVTFILSIFKINSLTIIEWGFPVIAIENLNQAILIDSACTGYRSILALAGLIVAVPNIDWKKRLKGIFYGSLILFIVNIIRITTTIILGYYFGNKVFDFAHTFLWREGLIFVVILMWYIWLKKSFKPTSS
jgi:exosortase/archaeosortase family protein